MNTYKRHRFPPDIISYAVWLYFRFNLSHCDIEDLPFVDDQGRESLNFQITVAIALAGCYVLSFVGIGVLLMPVVGVGALVLVIIASIKANEGERYRYPWAIRLLA